jgi:molecular chaperone GrpE
MDNKKKPLKKEEAEKANQNIKELEKMAEEYLLGWKRERADFENYKKNEISRVNDVIAFEKTRIFGEFLKILDNFQRAKNHLPPELADSDWVKGVCQIEGQMIDFLKKEGIEEIDCLGKEFDPCFHEAIQQEENSQYNSGEISSVLEKGYSMDGKLLRPAKVIIIK